MVLGVNMYWRGADYSQDNERQVSQRSFQCPDVTIGMDDTALTCDLSFHALSCMSIGGRATQLLPPGKGGKKRRMEREKEEAE